MSTISSVTFSPQSPAPGEAVTMTVTGNWVEADVITVTTPDGASGSGTLNVTEPLTISDPSGRDWQLVSNNTGTQAVYSGTA